MKRILLTQLFVLTLFFGAKAQTLPAQSSTNHPRAYDTRASFWNEENIQGSITKDKRWQYQLDIQYRRMADASNIPGGDHNNIFKNPYQQVYRPWIHYWVVPGAIRLSLCPVGYWSTWTAPDEGSVYSTSTNNKAVSGVKTYEREFRTCPQITFVNTYGRFQFFNRIRYEFRWQGTRVAAGKNDFHDTFDFNNGSMDFNTNTPGGATYGAGHKGRIRIQTRMQVLLTSKTMQKNTIYLNAWNELFIGVGRHVGYNGNLDQNRMVALIGWKVPCEYSIRIEAGVTYQTVFNSGSATKYAVAAPAGQTNTTKNNELNTAYTVYVIFDEFHTLFKGLKKKESEAARTLKQIDRN